MINLDVSNLLSRATNVEGCYHADVKNTVSKVLLDGEECSMVQYADLSSGFVIKLKMDTSGKAVIVNNDFICEIVFGKVEVIHD